ncbi:hypothetical protein EV379_2967 [Microterricola gilva]|uniref:Uncharacterized protein n=2 Tax=Microterricola gilva TaxID=393267 RepID=A0A4Q8APL4_9MICO|nr:hypothetical protein EV379_2967 [Microterricola gilva]
MSTRAARTLKGLAAASFSTFVALFSHVSGGGAMPGLLGVLVPLILALPFCVAFAGRRLSVPRLAASVAVSQFLFHSLFSMGATSAPAMGSMSGHAGHGMPIVLDAALPAQLGHSDSQMWAAHLVAGVLTVAALYSGEAVLARLAAFTCFLLRRIVPALVGGPATPPRLSLTLRAVDLTTRMPLGVFPSSAPHRGPPALAFS